MLVQRARSVLWKKWVAKHEYEELKEGAWLEPGLALLRKKVKEHWTEKHRNVARKIFLEGGWTQKRLFDVGWSDISQCQACQMEEGTEKHRLHHYPEWYEVRQEIPEVFRKLEQKQEPRGGGKEVLLNIHLVEVNGTGAYYKVSTPCIDDHHFKEEELKSVGELPKLCSQIVLKCLYLARIGRPDTLWSVNKLARSITNIHSSYM